MPCSPPGAVTDFGAAPLAPPTAGPPIASSTSYQDWPPSSSRTVSADTRTTRPSRSGVTCRGKAVNLSTASCPGYTWSTWIGWRRAITTRSEPSGTTCRIGSPGRTTSPGANTVIPNTTPGAGARTSIRPRRPRSRARRSRTWFSFAFVARACSSASSIRRASTWSTWSSSSAIRPRMRAIEAAFVPA